MMRMYHVTVSKVVEKQSLTSARQLQQQPDEMSLHSQGRHRERPTRWFGGIEGSRHV